MERYIYMTAIFGILYLMAFKLRGYKGREQVTLAEHIMDRYRRKK